MIDRDAQSNACLVAEADHRIANHLALPAGDDTADALLLRPHIERRRGVAIASSDPGGDAIYSHVIVNWRH